MIGELVRYRVPKGFPRDKALTDARKTIERWSSNPNLVRKHYLMGDDGSVCGFYVWKTRAAAEEGHNAEWQAHAKERMGVAPEFTYFDVMMILDNQYDTVDEFPAAEPALTS